MDNKAGFTVLIVDDEPEMCASLSEILVSHGFPTRFTTDPREAVTIIKAEGIGLVLLDVRMPDLEGMELLQIIKGSQHWIPVIMITGYPSIENAVKSMKYGALNFFVKPIEIPALLAEIGYVQRASLRQKAPQRTPGILTANDRMIAILHGLAKSALSDASVLITGESGTGKELAAHYLHFKSGRESRPFIKVNCASIPDTLLESELFGHEKGAYTDALSTHKGKFELADGGSIFFDEIGEMSPRTQAKLLRVLQDGEFERLGGSETLKADVRVITATNKDLAKMMAQGTFREDLYYRLAVVTVDLPPLRERGDDVMLLADDFLAEFNRKYEKRIDGFSSELERIFRGHNWPGNVRELRNCVERAVIFCESEVLSLHDLPSQYAELPVARDAGPADAFQDLYRNLSRELITDALQKSGGVKSRAAGLLHVTRKTLYNKMKKLGM